MFFLLFFRFFPEIRYNYFNCIPIQVRVAQRGDCHTQQQAVKTISSTDLKKGPQNGINGKTLEENNGDYRYIFSRKETSQQEIYIPVRRKNPVCIPTKKSSSPKNDRTHPPLLYFPTHQERRQYFLHPFQRPVLLKMSSDMYTCTRA